MQQIVERHFGRKTLAALRKIGVQILAITHLPDETGFARGQTGYMVCDNGTGKVLTFLDVLKKVGK